MKKSMKALLCGALLCPVLAGCVPTADAPPADTGSGTGESGGIAAYELIITGLQQELSAVQTLQKQQAAAYEARIAELEAALSEAEQPSLALPPDGDTAPAQQLFSYTTSSKGICITAYHGKATQVTVPAQIGDTRVCAIGEGAFRNTAVEQVIVEEGIEEIGWFAFSGCYRLSSVILPASVRSIGYGAFELCAASLRATCPAGSYAAAYAQSYGIEVIAK